jgi:hypothetical protein
LKTLKVIPVEHMDEVLRHALVMPDADKFLTEPSVPVDWRQPAERRDRDRRDEVSKMPVASAVPPPSAVQDQPSGSISDGRPTPPSDGGDNPGQSPDSSALPRGPMPGLQEH